MSAEVKQIRNWMNDLTYFVPESNPIQVFEFTPIEKGKLIEWIEKVKR